METVGLGLYFEDLPVGRQLKTVGRTIAEADITISSTVPAWSRCCSPRRKRAANRSAGSAILVEKNHPGSDVWPAQAGSRKSCLLG